MGKAWYEDEGKYFTKLNTFTDFGDCAQYLIDSKVTSSNQLACIGRSAGGLLVGAVVNMYPSLFKAAVGRLLYHTLFDIVIISHIIDYLLYCVCDYTCLLLLISLYIYIYIYIYTMYL